MARLTIPDEQTFAEFTVVTSTTAFPITFSLFAKADLTVLVDGTALDQSAFTFTGTVLDGGGYDGGTVTLNTAVDDVTVRIERNVAPARTSNFAPANSTPVGSVDQALNRLTALAQDLERKKITAPSGDLAGLFLSFDENGAPVAISSSIPSASVASFWTSLLLTTSNSAFLTALGNIAGTFVNFLQAGTGALTQTLQAAFRNRPLHVKDYGVVADGSTSDTLNLQKAVTAAATLGKDLDLGDGTILIGAAIDGTALSGNRLFGKATIKAASSTDFQYLLDISNTTGVTIEGITFDANKAGRGSAVAVLSCLKANTTIRNSLLQCTFKNTLGIAGPVSSIAVSASGGVLGLYAHGLRFIDLGTSANTKPSDGIFVRGTHCLIVDTYGENVTDHIAVLEGCSYSAIISTAGKNCTSFVAMSNDTSADVYGNIIDGVSGTCSHFGSFGAIVGVYTFGTGWIRNCLITNITARGASGATGGGPAMLFDGKIEGTASNLNLHPGASTGVMNQAILIDIDAGGSGLIIRDSTLEVEGSANVIRIQGSSDGVRIEDNYLREGAYGIYADGTSSFVETGNIYYSQSTAPIDVGGSAFYYGDTYQSWTPVYAGEAGDAAASFTATPTTTVAKARRKGKSAKLEVLFSGSVKSGTNPSYLSMTVPSWAAALGQSGRFVASGNYAGTGVTFWVRTMTDGTLRLYRGGGIGSFDASGGAIAIEMAFSIEYEVA